MSDLMLPQKSLPLARVGRMPPIRGPALAGLLILIVFFLGFGSWAALAPLSSAAVAPGAVRVESNRKTIQHLEGGIIQDLLVREGDRVRPDQILIQLDRIQAESHYLTLRHEYWSLRAAEARLIAERNWLEQDALGGQVGSQGGGLRVAEALAEQSAAFAGVAGQHPIAFGQELESRRDDPRAAEILTGQERIFATRRRSYQGQIEILRQQVEQLTSQIRGLEAQVASENRQLALLAEETADVSSLLTRGLERKARLLALRRQAAQLEGSRGEHQAEIARAEQAIGETWLEMHNLHDRLAAEVASELRDVQALLAEAEEEFRAAEDVFRRRAIRAPIAGTVVDLRFFTRGGVIEPGVPILDIVPQDDRLIIEARVSPLDIDVVEPGLPAQVRLTAFKQRRTPVLNGHLVQVSADSLLDEQTGVPYYKAQVEIDAEELRRLEGVALYPGMPVEVLIQTGERTLADYLLAPVLDGFARAFREE